jgi:GNAT superfamily N-acetyltransferase
LANLVVRLGGAADLAALTALNSEVHALHVARRPDQLKPLEPAAIERSLLDLLQNPSASVWVAEVDSSVLGYAVVTRQNRAENAWCPARAWWEIDQLGVAAAQRRSGVGRALVEHVMSEAKAAGVTQVELCAWAFNQEAHAAFERFGFVPKVIRFEHR